MRYLTLYLPTIPDYPKNEHRSRPSAFPFYRPLGPGDCRVFLHPFFQTNYLWFPISTVSLYHQHILHILQHLPSCRSWRKLRRVTPISNALIWNSIGDCLNARAGFIIGWDVDRGGTIANRELNQGEGVQSIPIDLAGIVTWTIVAVVVGLSCPTTSAALSAVEAGEAERRITENVPNQLERDRAKRPRQFQGCHKWLHPKTEHSHKALSATHRISLQQWETLHHLTKPLRLSDQNFLWLPILAMLYHEGMPLPWE